MSEFTRIISDIFERQKILKFLKEKKKNYIIITCYANNI